MRQALIVATALSLLLPCVAMAQQNQPAAQPAPQDQPPAASGSSDLGTEALRHPLPRPAPHPGGAPHAAAGPSAHPFRPGPRPAGFSRPLPPRGNQFWHRGQYFARVAAPVFVYPAGWGYRAWLIGERLPPLFLAPSYYYVGWVSLGLQAPLPGFAWVRFGPDLLLVNAITGEVDDVVYGVFI
jgi:hypothetical protein